MDKHVRPLPPSERPAAAWLEAEAIAAQDATLCAAIGENGARLLESLADRRDGPVRVLTHCNAGWLATCGIGTALAPVYTAWSRGVPVEVVVSETRPRNQGLLTAWELREAGIPATLIADNAAGLLLATGQVDVVITGADRIAANGDSANKVGTYLKALAAREAGVPFHIAAPSRTSACPRFVGGSPSRIGARTRCAPSVASTQRDGWWTSGSCLQVREWPTRRSTSRRHI